MVDRFDIREGMEVVGSDGAPVGVVGDVETGRILLARAADGEEGRTVALSRVERVEANRVLLSDSAAVTLGGFAARVAEATGDARGAGPDDPLPPAVNRQVPGARPRSNYYLPWIVGAVGLLLLFLLFKSCVANREEELVKQPEAAASQAAQRPMADLTDADMAGPELAPGTIADDLRAYLAGDAPAGRTFTFERLNFDTGSAAIRPADRGVAPALAQVLNAYPNARVRIVGYADARGGASANADLGRRRADAVADAIAAAGIARARIETASGGEGAPVAPNADPQGRFENRRTELVVTAR